MTHLIWIIYISHFIWLIFKNHRKFACEFKLDLSLSLGIGSPELKHFGHFELENQLGEFGFDIGLYEDDTFTTLASGRV